MAGTVTNGRAQSSSSAVGSMNSSSLPSLFRGQSSNRRVSASMLVSTECQTDSSLVVVQQQVREENARNDHMDPSTSARPLSQQSDNNGGPEMQDASTAAPRRRRREKRRHRRSHQQVVSSQPLQQHVQQVLHDQTMLVVDSTMSPSSTAVAAPVSPSNSDHLPDILNAHMPPPYSTLPHNSERCMGMGPCTIPITALSVPLSVPVMALSPPPSATTVLPPLHSSTPVAAAAVASSTTVAGPLLSSSSFSLPPAGGRRSRASMYAGDVEGGKSCCGVTVTQTVSIRWFIVMIAFVGICCAVVGTVLGAMRSSGREHLTVSLLMIGVGIVLITVSGIAWRLTSQDAPSCRAMLGLGGSSLSGVAGSPMGAENAECGGAMGGGVGGPGGVGSVEPTGRRFLSRIPPTYGRPHHPYAAMMYPEFQYRPPPPSYQASMQEYRLRLLLLDRDRQQQMQQQQQHSTPLSRACVAASSSSTNNSSGINPPVSPPPTYRSQANTLVRPSLPIREAEVSRPPSYRSRSGATNNGGNIIANAPIEPSVRSSVEVHHHHHRQQHHHDEEAEVEVSAAQVLIQAVVDAKMKSAFDESSLCSSMTTAVTTPTDRTKRLDKDNNTVTIVQTNSSSQVLAGCFAHPNQHQTTTTTTSSSSSSASSVLVTVTTPTVHHSHQTSSSTTSSTSSSPSHTNSQNLQVLAQL